MNDKTRKAIEQHGENVKTLFGLAAHVEPVGLCKRLRRVEGNAHKAATDFCNGELDEAAWEAASARALHQLGLIVGRHKIPVFVNGDPRGYALKIDDAWLKASGKTLHRDWGGYGIIAPDLNQN